MRKNSAFGIIWITIVEHLMIDYLINQKGNQAAIRKQLEDVNLSPIGLFEFSVDEKKLLMSSKRVLEYRFEFEDLIKFVDLFHQQILKLKEQITAASNQNENQTMRGKYLFLLEQYARMLDRVIELIPECSGQSERIQYQKMIYSKQLELTNDIRVGFNLDFVLPYTQLEDGIFECQYASPNPDSGMESGSPKIQDSNSSAEEHSLDLSNLSTEYKEAYQTKYSHSLFSFFVLSVKNRFKQTSREKEIQFLEELQKFCQNLDPKQAMSLKSFAVQLVLSRIKGEEIFGNNSLLAQCLEKKLPKPNEEAKLDSIDQETFLYVCQKNNLKIPESLSNYQMQAERIALDPRPEF
ncbi:hypothetical protein [Fluoribacter gormanii]|uniref:hypothetical protein n=1 Tax=Fluoribacter gormanii TaxID=464 RepID=UPI0010412E88|nr:hypothetical protein [Fluoribacter gormanii]